MDSLLEKATSKNPFPPGERNHWPPFTKFVLPNVGVRTTFGGSQLALDELDGEPLGAENWDQAEKRVGIVRTEEVYYA